MSVQIIQGNALNLPLEDDSVDLVVTSPPYFGLRSYTDAGEHYDGQIGSEPTPSEFIDALLAATREMVRVVKPSGSIWVNLGDRYTSGNGGDSNLTALGQRLGTGGGQKSDKAKQRTKPPAGVKPKSLMGLPWRYAIACIDQLGLILRAEVIWAKPNGLPESVTDRVRRSHEQWFHFTLQPRYYSAVDTIREEFVAPRLHDPTRGNGYDRTMSGKMNGATQNPLGKLPGSVWSIATQPLTVPPELGVDHFAAFPMEFPRRIIQGWSPSGICTACGEGRRPVVETQAHPLLTQTTTETRRREPSPEQAHRIAAFIRHHRESAGMTRKQVDDGCGTNTACSWWEGRSAGIQLPAPAIWRRLKDVLALPSDWDGIMLDTYMRPGNGDLVTGDVATSGRHRTTRHMGMNSGDYRSVTGESCGCDTPAAPTRPAVILDPFSGTGTTPLVASVLGRHGIGVDMSADYNRLATWRCSDPGQIAAAMQVEKPAPVADDQLGFDFEAVS